ncbi:MAG TPA: hypothetical protein PK095_04810 [Myxococcota bacterium]|nr:hypothetical protein [Myxococcota bacterium]
MTPSSQAARVAAALTPFAALAALHTGPDATAHNGFGIAPIYSEPFGLLVVDGSEPLVVRWTAREVHADQLYRFKAQLGDFPPTPSPPSKMRGGELLTTLPAGEESLSYELPLDLAALPTGAWRVYADFDEPPFCVELEQVPALVVIRKDGDPPPYGVLVTSPLVDSPIVDTSTRISVEAIASGAPRVTKIEAGEIIRDPEFPDLTLCIEFTWSKLFEVASDLPMVADPERGPDRFRLDYDWDTSTIPDGAYLLRVTTTDADGTEHVTWARRWVNVEHEVPIVPADPGPEPTPEDSPEVTETAEMAEAEPKRDDSSCAGAASTGWLALTLAALRALHLRRARAPRAAR